MKEYFVFRTKPEVKALEARFWNLVKDRFADNTVRWANVLEHPSGEAFAIVMPDYWRDVVPSVEQSPIYASLKDQDYMEANGWFPMSET